MKEFYLIVTLRQCGGSRTFCCESGSGSHFSSCCGSGSKTLLARETNCFLPNLNFFFSIILQNLSCVIFSVTMREEGLGMSEGWGGRIQERRDARPKTYYFLLIVFKLSSCKFFLSSIETLWHTIPFPPDGGTKQSWVRVPGFAFTRSRLPGVLGTRARDFFLKHAGTQNAKKKER